MFDRSAAHRGALARRLGWLAIASLLFVALAAPASSLAADGNNGTVKIHEGATDTEPVIKNEPHVCTFHLHFFFADTGQSGAWSIEEWAPGDKGNEVLSGTYDTGSDDEYWTGLIDTLPIGHYKLFWAGDLDKHAKMKVFWVTCNPNGNGGNGNGGNGNGGTGAGPDTATFAAATNAGSDAGRAIAIGLAGLLAAGFVLLKPSRLAGGRIRR